MAMKNASNIVKGLDLVYNMAANTIVAEQSLASAMRACKDDIKDIKRTVYAARISSTLKLSREASLIVLGLKVFNKEKLDDAHRTEPQEKAYTAARVWMTSFMQRHGFSAPAEKSKSENTGEMDTSKLKKAPAPKVSSLDELAAFCLADATRDYDFFLLNKAHKAVATPMGAELMGAYSDALQTVKDILAKHASK